MMKNFNKKKVKILKEDQEVRKLDQIC